MYKINNQFLLRGWKGMTCGLVNNETGTVRFFDKETYGMLMLCDGRTPFELDDLSEKQRDKLLSLIDEGIVAVCNDCDPISSKQEYKLYDNRYVNSIFWSVTGRCNYKCRHCYMNAPDAVLGELTHYEAISIIDQMAECGVQKVDITGGEPFVRKDIWELIDRLLSHGISIGQIYTNGRLVNEKVFDELEARGIKPEFNISFDGVGWHDWMRRVNGAEESAGKVFEMCQKRGFSCGAEMCLHKGNISSLPATVELLAKYNVRLKCGSIMPTELWNANSEGLGFTNEEYVEAMIRYIPEFYKAGMPVRVLLGGVIELKKGTSDYRIVAQRHDGTDKCLNKYMCGAVRMNAYLSPEGRLIPCMPMTSWKGQDRFPKVTEIGLKAGLSDSLYMEFANGRIKDLMERNAECRNCEYRLLCGGGCRANALENGDDLYGPDRYQCFIFKNGYVDKIRRAADEAIAKYCK